MNGSKTTTLETNINNERLQLHNNEISNHFSKIAPDYIQLKNKNSYYNNFLIKWCQAMLPANKKVLDMGCGRGDVLSKLSPLQGKGIDSSKTMIDLASSEHPNFEFSNQEIEDFKGENDYDAVTLINTLEYTYDIGTVLDKAYDCLKDNGRVLITTANPIWSPIFTFASKIGFRIPESRRLFVTNEDLVNLLNLHGFEVVYKKMALVMPKYIPLLSNFINWFMAQIPLLHLLGSTQLIIGRKKPKDRREYSVSVVIPCHNEIGNIDRCIKEMRKFGTRTELIIVDDGSTDGTAQAVKPNLNPDIEVKVLSYSPNEGKGRAVKKGFDQATGDIVMIVDADLTTHPDELEPLYEAFATGRAEFINCTRFVYPMDGAAMKFANYLGNKMFTILVSLIMENRVSDTLCGTKAMFREDYKNMTMGRDPWGDYDFLFGAAQLRLVIRELPVHYRDRLAGISKMNSMKHTKNLLKMCWHGFWQVKTLQDLNQTLKND